ncbi:gpi-anchored cell wall beta-1,3-endoglucanase [Trichoderma arundinaceum]|uniref:Probable glucan endo-1,3-beta-glucosidase eglC n=1 Tax=Trichoderma arundinaceum TaxID=490622 RepID=A0A395N7Y9_TRIAR|nr:gpi-anchored cell wall beta-1,3-endoglucanase [Trichoderma arundinaceum]
MPSSSTLLTLATAISAVNAAYQGFNYGSTFTNGQPKAQNDFEAEFKTAAGLDGTNGAFTSARLYTMIQGGTPNSPISAIPAAINTKTSLLFGLWASAGDAAFDNEIAALKSTISQYCGQLDGLVAGISIGSEDLYRITPTGVASNAGPGAQPGTLVNYINQVRDTIKGSCLADVPVGHVDTWNAWVLDSNKPVIDAVDWLGMDTYPYYENTKANGIANAKSLYEAALEKIQNAGPGKDVWVTETGWPVNGVSSGDAIASTSNAQEYWQQVGCPNFGKVNVWWYTLQDAAPDAPNPSFGLIGNQLTEKPLFDLSCKNVNTNPSNPTSSAAPSKPASSSAAASSTKASSSSDSGSASTTTSEPQSTDSGSQTTTAEPQTSTSEAQTSTSEPETSTSEQQTTTAQQTTEQQTTTSEPQTTGSSGSQTTASEPQTTGNAPVTTGVPSTFSTVPFPTANSTVTASAPGGTGSSSGPSAPSSTVPGNSGNKLGSFGAAAAAIAVAAIVL